MATYLFDHFEESLQLLILRLLERQQAREEQTGSQIGHYTHGWHLHYIQISKMIITPIDPLQVYDMKDPNEAKIHWARPPG